MAKLRPKQSEALHTTHPSGAASPAQQRYFPTFQVFRMVVSLCRQKRAAAERDPYRRLGLA